MFLKQQTIESLVQERRKKTAVFCVMKYSNIIGFSYKIGMSWVIILLMSLRKKCFFERIVCGGKKFANK